MEIFGGVASGLAVVGAAVGTAKLVSVTYADIRDAPSDLASIKLSLRLIHGVLQQITSLQHNNHVLDSLTDLVGQSFYDGLDAIREAVIELQVEYNKHSSLHAGKRIRIKWALVNRQVILKQEQRLQTAIGFFNTVLALVQLKGHSVVLENLERISLLATGLEKRQELWRSLGCTNHGASEADTNVDATLAEAEYSCSTTTLIAAATEPKGRPSGSRTCTRVIAPWLLFFGFHLSAIASKAEKRTRYSVSFRFRPPWIWPFKRQLKSRMIAIDFAFDQLSTPWRLVPLASPGIVALRVIPKHGGIVSACVAGNVDEARRLFASGRASPYDITPDNLSLLYYAIESGSPAMVELLVKQGVDVNQTFGLNQTTPLQWAMYCRRLDICRILLRQGARLDHVSVFGWTALVYLFEGIRAGPGMRDNIRMMDFLELLDDDKDVLDLHICDTNGEDALQHAARASTGDMLLWLLRYGSALDRYGEDPWQAEENPMRLAIINGNMSAFQALLPYYPGGIDVEDEVGFTMLDYAARRGHRNMVRYLLDLGAKATLPEYSMTGEGTIRIEGDVDPDEYVEWTRDSYFVYLSVLEEKNMIVVRKEEDDSERYVDLYWDAKEDAGQYHLGYHED